jgi:hypothetical protein
VADPEDIDLGDDRFVLYYTSKDLESGLQCIGVATSGSAKGPYVDDRGEPFICQRELGGSIDASPVIVDVTRGWSGRETAIAAGRPPACGPSSWEPTAPRWWASATAWP